MGFDIYGANAVARQQGYREGQQQGYLKARHEYIKGESK
jgi:hypothetical protein